MALVTIKSDRSKNYPKTKMHKNNLYSTLDEINSQFLSFARTSRKDHIGTYADWGYKLMIYD